MKRLYAGEEFRLENEPIEQPKDWRMATKWLIGGLLLASGIAFVAGQQEMSSNTFSPDELDQQNAAQITQHQNNFNDGQELMTVSIALLTGSTLAASILAVTEK